MVLHLRPICRAIKGFVQHSIITSSDVLSHPLPFAPSPCTIPEKLLEFMSGWSDSSDHLPGMMENLYIALYERGYIQEVDVTRMQHWCVKLSLLLHRQ